MAQPLYELRAAARGAPAVAVDVDEVLAGFVPALLRFHNERYGTSFEMSDVHSYHFSDVDGFGTEAEVAAKIQEFFASAHFADMPVVEGARAVLERHRADVNFYIVTSRQHSIERQTLAWLQRHYPGLFCGVLFGNHYGTSGAKRSKEDMCAEVGADMLVDDNIRYITGCAAARPGMRCVLLDVGGAYAWSRGDGNGDASFPPNAVRVLGWAAVDRELERLVAAATAPPPS